MFLFCFRSLKEISPPLPEPTPNSSSHPDSTLGIRLFTTSTSKVTEKDLQPNTTGTGSKKKQKYKKKGKHKAADSSDSDSESETEKLKSVAVSAEWVLQN